MIYQRLAYPRAHDIASRATNPIRVSEGRMPEHLLNNPGTVPNLQLRLSIYMGLFLRNVLQIALNPTKNLSMLSPCIRVAKALSGVSLTSARIPWNNNSHIIVTSQ